MLWNNYSITPFDSINYFNTEIKRNFRMIFKNGYIINRQRKWKSQFVGEGGGGGATPIT